MKYFALLLILFTILYPSNAIQFGLRQGEETCLSKEVLQNDYIKGVFSLIPEQEQISVSVRDPHGDLVYVRPGISEGNFAYTSPKTGAYKACFQNNLTPGLKTIKLNFLTSDDTKTLDQARKSSLKPIESQVKHVQSLIQTIKRDEIWSQEKQQEMRDDSDSTHTLVIILNVLLMIVVVGGYFVQMWYLKAYFRNKRLLD